MKNVPKFAAFRSIDAKSIAVTGWFITRSGESGVCLDYGVHSLRRLDGCVGPFI